MKFALVLTVALFGFAAALEFDTPCRSLPVVSNFDMRNYAGNWYELKRYETTTQLGGDCSTFDYSYDFAEAVTTQLNVENRWVYTGNVEEYQRGVAVMANPASPTTGQMVITYENAPTTPVNYFVLGTDYENYSVVWNCVNLASGGSNEDAWVLSKSQEGLNPDVVAEVEALVALHLDDSQMRETRQTDCLGIDPLA